MVNALQYFFGKQKIVVTNPICHTWLTVAKDYKSNDDGHLLALPLTTTSNSFGTSIWSAGVVLI